MVTQAPSRLENRIICIVGPKGTGKTERAARMYGLSDRALVFNVAFDKQYYARSTHIVDDDVITAGEMMRREPKFRISFESENLEQAGQGLRYVNLDPLIRECYQRGPMTIFLDEAHLLCSAQCVSPETLRMVYIGRHHLLSSVFIMQRTSGVHPVVRTNADEYHFHQITEPLDLKFIATKCGYEVAEVVQNLRRLKWENGKAVPGQCLVWTVEGETRVEEGTHG